MEVRIRGQSKALALYSDVTHLFVFGGEHSGHSIKILPLCIDIRLELFSITPKLAKASLLAGVGFNSRIIGPLVDAVADTIKYLVEWEQATAYGNFDQLGALIRL